MLPFPNPGSKTIGLVTREKISVSKADSRVAVFVPTTPNPTSGYLLLMQEKDLVYLDLSVEDALKYVISCGVVMMPFQKIDIREAHKRMHALEPEEGGQP